MSVPIEYDRRYKINRETVDKMREMRKQNHTCEYIGKQFGVSHSTVVYWTNTGSRNEHRKRVAKRRHDPDEHSKDQVKRRKRQWKEYSPVYLVDAVESSKYEKRSKRKTIFGKPIDEMRKKAEEYKTGGRKIE